VEGSGGEAGAGEKRKRVENKNVRVSCAYVCRGFVYMYSIYLCVYMYSIYLCVYMYSIHLCVYI
jgi:hypothetical protein